MARREDVDVATPPAEDDDAGRAVDEGLKVATWPGAVDVKDEEENGIAAPKALGAQERRRWETEAPAAAVATTRQVPNIIMVQGG